MVALKNILRWEKKKTLSSFFGVVFVVVAVVFPWVLCWSCFCWKYLKLKAWTKSILLKNEIWCGMRCLRMPSLCKWCFRQDDKMLMILWIGTNTHTYLYTYTNAEENIGLYTCHIGMHGFIVTQCVWTSFTTNLNVYWYWWKRECCLMP